MRSLVLAFALGPVAALACSDSTLTVNNGATAASTTGSTANGTSSSSGAGGGGASTGSAASSSATTSTGTTGGQGGAGGVVEPECTTAADCPAMPVGQCEEVQCIGGACGIGPTPAGTPLPEALQTPGDCYLKVCNGASASTAQPDPSDVPADEGLECTNEVCIGTTPTHQNKPDGTACMPNHPSCPCQCLGGSCGAI